MSTLTDEERQAMSKKKTLPRFRVEVAYRFKRRRAGICVGMEVDAADEDEAEQKALDQHIKPYPNRVLAYTTIERVSS